MNNKSKKTSSHNIRKKESETFFSPFFFKSGALFFSILFGLFFLFSWVMGCAMQPDSAICGGHPEKEITLSKVYTDDSEMWLENGTLFYKSKVINNNSYEGSDIDIGITCWKDNGYDEETINEEFQIEGKVRSGGTLPFSFTYPNYPEPTVFNCSSDVAEITYKVKGQPRSLNNKFRNEIILD